MLPVRHMPTAPAARRIWSCCTELHDESPGLGVSQQTNEVKRSKRTKKDRLRKRRPKASFLAMLVAIVLLIGTFPHVTIAQEKPFYSNIEFNSTIFYKHNLCARQKQLYNGEVELRHALKGLDLSVFLIDYSNTEEETDLFALNDDGEIRQDYPGLFVRILDEVSKRAGFTWRNSYATLSFRNFSYFDGNTNATFADFLHWSVNAYDLSQGDWSKTIARVKRGISFPEGWLDLSTILVDRVTSTADEGFSVFSFLLPFEPGVWALIAAAIIATGLLYYLLERLDASSDARNLDRMPGATVFLSAMVFTSHFEFRPDSHAARLLAWSWTFWALIVGAAYTANLASFLIRQQMPNIGIQSLEEAVRKGVSVCVGKGTSQDVFVTNNYKKANLIRKMSVAEAYQGLWTGECDVVLCSMYQFDHLTRLSEANTDCSLRWTGRTVEITSGGFATAIDTGTLCTSLVSYAVDLHVQEMKADETFDGIWKEYIEIATDQTCPTLETSSDSGTGNSDNSRLNVQDLGGIFLFHAVLCAISVAIASFPYLRKRFPKASFPYLRKRFPKAKADLEGEDRDEIRGNDIENDNSVGNRRRPEHRESLWAENE